MRFTGCILNDCFSFCFHCHQDEIFCSSDRRKSLGNIGSYQTVFATQVIRSLFGVVFASHTFHIFDKRIHRTSSQLTSLRKWHRNFSKTSKQWTRVHYRRFHFLTQFWINDMIVHCACIKCQWRITNPCCFSSQLFKNLKHIFYITCSRNIVNSYLLISKDDSRDKF